MRLRAEFSTQALKKEVQILSVSYKTVMRKSVTLTLSILRFLGPTGPINLGPRHSEGCGPKRGGDVGTEYPGPTGEGNRPPCPNLESGPLNMKELISLLYFSRF